MKNIFISIVLLLSTQTFAASTHIANRMITLQNLSSETIVEFHASRVSTDKWEEDILGHDVLPPGYKVKINVDDGTGACLFDFKTVSTHHTIIRRNVDVCTVYTYTIEDE